MDTLCYIWSKLLTDASNGTCGVSSTCSCGVSSICSCVITAEGGVIKACACVRLNTRCHLLAFAAKVEKQLQATVSIQWATEYTKLWSTTY